VVVVCSVLLLLLLLLLLLCASAAHGSGDDPFATVSGINADESESESEPAPSAPAEISLEQWKEQVLSSAKQQQQSVHHDAALANASDSAAAAAALVEPPLTALASPEPAANNVSEDAAHAAALDTAQRRSQNQSDGAATDAADAAVAVDAAPLAAPLRPVVQSKEAEFVFDQFNYAAIECGAKVLDANREASETAAVISRSLDHYMLNECAADMWFAVELCEEINVTAVMLQNAEFFSSMLRQVELLGSNSYPASAGEWVVLARLELANSREPQRFILPALPRRNGDDDHFFKFIRVTAISHYGSEFYCPLTRFAVHGVTLSQAMSEHLQHDSREVTELQSVIKTVDLPLHPRAAAAPPPRRPPMCVREDAALYFQRQCRPANAPNVASTAAPSSSSSSAQQQQQHGAAWSDGVWRDLADLSDAELLDASDGSFAAFRAANLARTSPRDFDMPLMGHGGQSMPLFEYSPAPAPPTIASPDAAQRNQIVPLRDLTVKKSQEAVFRMLASRVKALEINQTLIDRYLEQLTKKIDVRDHAALREQLADSVRRCSAALSAAEKARERAEHAAANSDWRQRQAAFESEMAAMSAAFSARIDALRAENDEALRLMRFDVAVAVVVTLVFSLLISFLCTSSQRRTVRTIASLDHATPVRIPFKAETPASPASRSLPGSARVPRKFALDFEPPGVLADGEQEDGELATTCQRAL
jgi:hypothetical protein